MLLLSFKANSSYYFDSTICPSNKEKDPRKKYILDASSEF